MLIKNNDADALAVVESAYENLVSASHGRDPRTIGDSDLDFHWALVDASGSLRLRRYMPTLVLETRIASFSVSQGYVVRRDVEESHESILAAIRAGDADAAVAAVGALMDKAVARLTGVDASGLNVEPVEEPHHTSAIALEPLSPP